MIPIECFMAHESIRPPNTQRTETMIHGALIHWFIQFPLDDGKKLLESIVRELVRAIRRFGEFLPGHAARIDFAPYVAASLLLLVVVFVVHRLIIYPLGRSVDKKRITNGNDDLWWSISQVAVKPLSFAFWVLGIYLSSLPVLLLLSRDKSMYSARLLVERLVNIGLFVALYWLLYRFIDVCDQRLRVWANASQSNWQKLVLPLIGKTLRVVVPVIAILAGSPLLGLPPAYDAIVAKASSLFILGAVAWLLFQIVGVGERFILLHYNVSEPSNLKARQLYTQIAILKRTLHAVITIFTLSAALMLFEPVRNVGASVLASAGVIGIIVGVAAQRTIANLFAGFQLALTQPIRIDDVVVVENEWGRIEEITLTYVVVRIWDCRRLILPLSYFIERPFQNWTRTQPDIWGTVFLYTDYTIPVDAVREELKRIVGQSNHWDGKVCGLQVTNATDRALELRALVSAADAGKAWDLRCEIREKLVLFVQQHYPESLPRERSETRATIVRAED
jgi:small-conductance mechanosensitive channel